MLDDLDDGRIPVVAVAVVEDAVAPDHEIVAVTGGERRRDGQCLAAAAPSAVAVGQIDLTEIGQGRMFGRVVDTHAEVARAPVQIEGAGLEDGLASRRVEVAQ